ncbi:TetR/AcrR family transcriptional regulator [Kineosporia succinea]|uniref:AcrR family transcriptional regulator n=1 Tax=Kineosporia succinea TaxID=84632 RepID=A0ABT9NXM7_9ACTN|nr:TetR/AcrR family transcriptional regulator [Kineosporia succinea]MDP9824909.1 AcrR family transcriptional regulator [Kineosporia succinea]
MNTSSGRTEAPDDALSGVNVAERILRAAGEVFGAKGLHATLADVAATAGVGVATVYRRFSNKDELILALFEIRFATARDDVARALEADDPWEGFVEFFEGGVREFSRDRGFREFVITGYSETFGWARGSSSERVEEVVHRHQLLMRDSIGRMVRRCQDAGVIRHDVVPHDLLALTMAAVSSIDFAAQKGSSPETYRRVIGVILDGLRPSRSGVTPLPGVG